MHTEHHRWWSPSLNREMAMKVYGHWGKPVVVFPCSRGRYFDYEGMGMIEAVAGFIDAGKIKLFCVDSVDEECWFNFAVSASDRNGRHECYDRYIIEEVVPFIRTHCRMAQERVMANGCSMGAYHAVNFFLKHPDVFEGKERPCLDRLLGTRRESRLALVVPADELFPGAPLRLTSDGGAALLHGAHVGAIMVTMVSPPRRRGRRENFT